MTIDELVRIASEMTDKTYQDNNKLVQEILFDRTSNSECFDQIKSKIILNSVCLSAQISVQTVVRLLCHLEVIDSSEYIELPKRSDLKLL